MSALSQTLQTSLYQCISEYGQEQSNDSADIKLAFEADGGTIIPQQDSACYSGYQGREAQY